MEYKPALGTPEGHPPPAGPVVVVVVRTRAPPSQMLAWCGSYEVPPANSGALPETHPPGASCAVQAK
jgi:hypothetical protein